MRTVLAAMTALLLAAPALAENPSPHSGMRTFVTGKPYAAYLDELTASVWANGMGIVAQACADCGAKSLGVTIPGNRVVEVFDPGFAVRMLKASTAAGHRGAAAPVRDRKSRRHRDPDLSPAERGVRPVWGARARPDGDGVGLRVQEDRRRLASELNAQHPVGLVCSTSSPNRGRGPGSEEGTDEGAGRTIPSRAGWQRRHR